MKFSNKYYAFVKIIFFYLCYKKYVKDKRKDKKFFYTSSLRVSVIISYI